MMRTRPPASLRSERGTVLILAAISLLVLMGFLTFVLDSGILWLSRVQAQNSADAGALAGAVGLAYDDLSVTPVVTGKAGVSATNAAQANPVWNATPTSVVSFACPTGMAGRCVRVDVYRNGELGSTPLPTIFGPLLGIAEQGVRATATARVAVGNTTDCMRPWAVADKWIENASPATAFNRYVENGNNAGTLLSPADEYVPPSTSSQGSGYRVPNDVGTQVILKNGNPNSGNENITSGWFMPLRLPDGAGGYFSGANDMEAAIRGCVGGTVSLGDRLPLESGNMVGPTAQGLRDLIALDPSATFNMSTQQVQNSCDPTCAPFSPRIVPLSVFDVDDFQSRRARNDWSGCPVGGKCVKVVNILGFFVDRQENSGDIVGYLVRYPGTFETGPPNVGVGSSFLVNIQLVR